MAGIDFRQIPTTWLVPGVYVEFDWSAANQGLVRGIQRLLVFAHKLTGAAGAANTPIALLTANDGVALGGRGSMAARMAEVVKANNDVTECTIILVAEPAAGTKAVGSFTFTGPATGAGVTPLMIDGELVHVATNAGDTAATIATAAAAAINANADLPVTAAVDGVDTTKVNLTCRWKGESGNAIPLRSAVGYWRGLALPGGVGVAVTAMAGGAGVPDLAAAIDAMADTHYTDVIFPWTDSVSVAALRAEMEDRWGGLRQKEGQIWTGLTGTHGDLTTFGNGVNSDTGSTLGLGKSPSAPWTIAAAYGAVAAYALGIDPSRQLRGRELKKVLPPEEKDRFSDTERNLLLQKGISTATVTLDGKVVIERAVTWHQVNDLDLPDPSRRDVMYVATAAAMRQTGRNYVSTRFPDYKLADDGTNFGSGQAIITPKLFRGHVIHLARLWEEAGWVEAVDGWKDGILCIRNDEDANRLDTLIPPDIINNAMVFAFLIQPRI